MAGWHFTAVVCANKHVLMGHLWSDADISVDRAEKALAGLRTLGTKKGIFTGACGACKSRDLHMETFDTGCATKADAAAWVALSIERWRTDKPAAKPN